MNVFNLINQRFFPQYQGILEQLPTIEYDGRCECCGRNASSFGNMFYQFQDSGKKTHTVCQVCAIINQQNADYLGFENGTIGYKLSSFKGGYLIIPTDDDQKMELWTGGKYLDRVKDSETLAVVAQSGHAAKLALLKDRRPKLVIELSLRREMWLRYLDFSTTHQLRVATEAGLVSVNHDDFEQLANTFDAMAFKPATKKNLITQLRLNKTGKIRPDNKKFVAAMQDCDENLLAAIRTTSQEPIAFLFMLDALSA